MGLTPAASTRTRISPGPGSGRGSSTIEPNPDAAIHPDECRLREVLDRVGDKWSVLVIYLLGDGTRRFMDLLRSIDGISQRMLTVTLRGLERDGLVTRTVHPVVPPRVDYALTPLGRTLLESIGPLMAWSVAHTGDVGAARAAYDARPSATIEQ
jgi:DNA-binding HxlR family transcriptional regulator